MGNAIFTNLMKSADAASKDILKTIASIVDENSFVETDRFISDHTDLGIATGEGVVGGFAHICDVRIGLFATNSKVLKGSIGRANAKKIVKTIDAAVSAGLPVVGILDTAGARFGEGIDAMEGYADIFAALSAAYGTVPTAMVVKGADFGLSAYFCAVTDICIAYKSAQIATAGPLVMAGNTKEDPAKIGVGASLYGNCDVVTHLVENDKGAKDVLAAFVSLTTQPVSECADDPNRTAKAAALKNAEELPREIFDKNSVLPVRDGFAKEVQTGFARLGGIAVGYVCTMGKLTADGAGKVTELLNTCESFALPVIDLVDCDGVKTCAACDGKTMRAVSDMLFTYNSICVPKLALIYGKAIGVGYAAFAAKSNIDYSVAWADAQIGVMASVSAAQLLYKDEIAQAKNREQAEKKLAQAYAEENLLAPIVAQKGYLDNVIEPALSRPYLAAALQIFATKE